jgi:lipopolysaccharide export system permease protein
MGLQVFFIGMDLMQNFKKLPDSANLQILYVIFKFLYAINYTLPLSVVFALIASKFYLIRSNELVSLYALGISKRRLLAPFFFTSLALIFFYIFLNTTHFVYSNEYAENILKYRHLSNTSSNLFLKYFDNYVYFKKLDPLKKEAYGIKVFKTKDFDLQEVIKAKKAYFKDGQWHLFDVTIIKKPKISGFEDKKLFVEEVAMKKVLKDFRPKIIEGMFDGKGGYSILDAIDAIELFVTQNVNIDKVKSSLYVMIFFPLFAPLMVVIIFYYIPISNRFFDLALHSFILIFATLLLWGLLFMLTKITLNAVIAPEIGIILPIALLSLFAGFLFYKNN